MKVIIDNDPNDVVSITEDPWAYVYAVLTVLVTVPGAGALIAMFVIG